MPLQSLRQSLQQKQALKLSPQQVQLMKLMQVPTMDMEQRIKEELQNNPALEEGEGGIFGDEISLSRLREDAPEDRHGNDDDSASDARTDAEGGREEASGDAGFDAEGDAGFDAREYLDPDRGDYAYKLKSDNYRAPEDRYEAPVKFLRGLQEQLKDELGMLALNEKQRQIGEVIIGNLDEDGYLQRTVPAMVNDMAFSLNLMATEEEVQEVLAQVQTLEPSGIGARDLRECLLIQVRNLMNEDGGLEGGANGEGRSLGDLYVLQTAQELLTRTFDDFVKRQYTRIAEKLKVDEEDVRDAVDLIKTLNPKPGMGGGDMAGEAAPTVIPDFYLSNENGALVLGLNGKNEPNLRLSPSYLDMLEQYEETEVRGEKGRGRHSYNVQAEEAVSFVKQKIDSARWFMDMIQQRRTTMLRVMQAIVDFQHDCLLDGDEKLLKPMRLKDIAGKVGMDVSTISRVINNKYIQTHFGTFAVKKLFSQGIENEAGEEISTSQIKLALHDLIAGEDKANPYTDEVLVDLLKEKGFVVARRTVAKYREGMGLPVARLRRGY